MRRVGDRYGVMSFVPLCPWGPFLQACVYLCSSLHGSAAVSDGVCACSIGAVIRTEFCISGASYYVYFYWMGKRVLKQAGGDLGNW